MIKLYNGDCLKVLDTIEENSQQPACENFIKRPLGITVTRKEDLKNEQQRKNKL